MSKADGLGSNIPKQTTAPVTAAPSTQVDMADLLAMMASLKTQNEELQARLELAEATGVINRPGGHMEEELFARAPASPVKRMQIRRVWIILEENKNIPRNGQIFGANGMTYLLRPGLRAHVPITIVDILNHSIEGTPVVNPDTLQIEKYVQALRYPYRLVSAPRENEDGRQLPDRRRNESIYEEAA